jgi:tRNA dimethylallyltransferase
MIKLIIGPTASGKSALGIEIARKINGIIINMDSMQIYKSIPIITAQPSIEDLAKVPHKLYGFATNNYNLSFGKWIQMLQIEVKNAQNQGLTPIIVGGTMMYAYMLLNGFSPIPEISDATRNSTHELYEEIGHDEFLLQTQKMDEETPHDKQRLIYNHCLILQTGKTLLEYSLLPQKKVFEGQIQVIIPKKTRKQVYDICNSRFLDMISDGLFEEVKSVMEFVDSPIKRATGFHCITQHFSGEIDYSQMVEKCQQETRNYAKKQIMWLRKMAKEDLLVEAKESIYDL